MSAKGGFIGQNTKVLFFILSNTMYTCLDILMFWWVNGFLSLDFVTFKLVRAGSSLFFQARAEPEPIFFGPGRARAITFMPRAFMSQKNFYSSLLRA